MFFASPLFLLLLAPWALVTLYLLIGQRPVQSVPFVSLWRGPVHSPRQKRRLYPPARATVLGILAMLLAVLASAEPRFNKHPLQVDAATSQPVVTPRGHILGVVARRSPVASIWVQAQGQGTILVRAPGVRIDEPFKSDVSPIDRFINLPSLPAGLTVGLGDAADEWRIESRATWPRIERRAAVPPSEARAIDTFIQHRPAGEGSAVLSVVNDAPVAGPAIIVPIGRDLPSTNRPRWADHPILQGVHFDSLAQPMIAPAPTEWTPIVWLDDTPVVATAPGTARQVWVGLRSVAWSKTPDFVIFWANALAWAGQGQETVAAIPRAPAPKAGTPIATRYVPLAPGFIYASLICLILSALWWPDRRDEKNSPKTAPSWGISS